MVNCRVEESSAMCHLKNEVMDEGSILRWCFVLVSDFKGDPMWRTGHKKQQVDHLCTPNVVTGMWSD